MSTPGIPVESDFRTRAKTNDVPVARLISCVDLPRADRRWLLEKIYFVQGITVGELCAESTVSAGTVAHHIKILKEAGLIQMRRHGPYRLLVAQGNTWETYLDCLANLGKAAPVSVTDL